LGVDPKRIYVDHGLTGTNPDRPGLRQALAACRRGDTLVVTVDGTTGVLIPTRQSRAAPDQEQSGQNRVSVARSGR
jgi:hypothetical protein